MLTFFCFRSCTAPGASQGFMNRAAGSPSLPHVVCDVPHTEVRVVTFSWCPAEEQAFRVPCAAAAAALPCFGVCVCYKGTPEYQEAHQNSMHTVKPLSKAAAHRLTLAVAGGGYSLVASSFSCGSQLQSAASVVVACRLSYLTEVSQTRELVRVPCAGRFLSTGPSEKSVSLFVHPLAQGRGFILGTCPSEFPHISRTLNCQAGRMEGMPPKTP